MRILSCDETSDNIKEYCSMNNIFISTEEIKRDDLREYLNINEIDTLIVKSTKVDREVLSSGIKYVIQLGSESNNIDIEECDRRKISVYKTQRADGISVSELTFGLILSISRNINNNRTELGHELFDKTIGIIGFGKMGNGVKILSKAFSMNVKIYDPKIKSSNLDDLLRTSDIISLHCPYNGTPVITEDEIMKMKQGVILINTSCDELIVEEDLIKYEDKFLGIGMDVYSNEYINPHFIVSNKYLITSHIGSQTYECQKRISEEVIEQLRKISKQLS